MNETMPPTEEGKLRALLGEARPAPDLPPGFQNAVWRRIERAAPPTRVFSLAEWLDRAAARLVRPRLALAGATVMLLLGISIGVGQAGNLANDLAKRQYVAAVSPLSVP